MIRKRSVIIITFCLSLFFVSNLSAHTNKMALLVDTDVALDDITALTMILNSDSEIFDLRLIVP